MGLLDNLVVSAVAAVVEAYAVRALLPQHDLRSILYIAFGVNSSLCLAWASFIYPVFVNPLRHLPRVGPVQQGCAPRDEPPGAAGCHEHQHIYDVEKPWKVRNFLARVIGFGLILSEGPQHQRQRKAITPSFNIKIIRAACRLMWEKTGILLEEVGRISWPVLSRAPTPAMAWETLSRLTLDVIGAAAMGRDFQSLTHDRNQVSDSFQVILEPS
ncbi:hypothetical protein MAP00_002990 [Monascus purpureus]|nr:hypothetical protein MAP00_002990 [Monascus purpureus]